MHPAQRCPIPAAPILKGKYQSSRPRKSKLDKESPATMDQVALHQANPNSSSATHLQASSLLKCVIVTIHARTC